MTRHRAFVPPRMTFEEFCAEPAAPPAPARLPLHTIIAAAVRSDRRTFGRPCIARVVAKLDRERAMEIVLDPEYGAAWKRAAGARLAELEGGAA
jgi:hypothetical protein